MITDVSIEVPDLIARNKILKKVMCIASRYLYPQILTPYRPNVMPKGARCCRVASNNSKTHR